MARRDTKCDARRACDRIKAEQLGIGRVIDVVDVQSGHGFFRTGFGEIGDVLAILDQCVADNLDLMIVSIRRAGNLPQQAWIGRVGDIENR